MPFFDKTKDSPKETETPTEPTQDTTQEQEIEQPQQEGPQRPIMGEGYEHSIIDSRHTDDKKIITHIEGSPWYVSYFSQLVSDGEELSPLQLGKDPVYQQYHRIDHFELRVIDTLSSTQSDDSNSFETTGGARIYTPLIPNAGDMFIADVGDGNLGVFAITDNRRLTIYEESAYEVEYRLVSYLTGQYKSNLDLKTTKQSVFVKELFDKGQNPIIDGQNIKRYKLAGEYFQELLDSYLHTFYSRQNRTIILPDQDGVTFDHFLTAGLIKTLDTDMSPLLRSIRNYSCRLYSHDNPVTFWDALINLSYGYLGLADEKLQVINTKFFSGNPQLDGLLFSGIDYTLYPLQSKDNNIAFAEGLSPSPDTDDILSEQTVVFQDTTIPIIHPVTKDDYYVLSEAFYNEDRPNQSLLERTVHSLMSNEELEPADVIKLASKSPTWPALERFYYTPIILILLSFVKHQV